MRKAQQRYFFIRAKKAYRRNKTERNRREGEGKGQVGGKQN